MKRQLREFPAPDLLTEAAECILSEEAGCFPDLSGITILVPNLHAAQDLSRALAQKAHAPFLLPRITTLSLLAEALFKAPQAERELALYGALREKKWFAETDLWPLVKELVLLFDELTRHRVSLPETASEFQDFIEKTMGSNDALMFEARLVHQLWQAMEAEGASRVLEYYRRLGEIADNAGGPLYVVGVERKSRAEDEFLSRWAAREEVHELREIPGCPVSRFLTDAWSEDIASGFLERSEPWKNAESPLGHLSIFAANGLEDEARSAAAKIREWLLAGKSRIAVVVADRLVARRVRALLERAQILAEDETGWTFSTTSAATAIMRWLEAVAGRFYHLDLLDLLKSPFIFSDWDGGRKKLAVYQIERLVRENNLVAGIEHCRRLASGEAAHALIRLERGAAHLRGKNRSASAWLNALFTSLEELGVSRGLAADAAGSQLLENLQALRRQDDRTLLSFGEWRRWLDLQLESLTFRDAAIQSPVVFTHLAATAAREFDAVMILGADAAHFPGSGGKRVFFNQSVRRDLGLPSAEEEASRFTRELIALLSRPSAAWISWQKNKNGEANLLSPHFERLQSFHLCACGRDLTAAMPPQAGSAPIAATPAAPPAPALPAKMLPKEISASGYNSLLACPYQYYSRHVLKLGPLAEVEEKLDRADFGTHVHRILQLFHSRYPEISGLEVADAVLAEISREVFADDLEADYLSHAWLIRWQSSISSYLCWQRARENAGWRIADTESARELKVELAGGEPLRLRGRIDRIDRRGEEYSVVDYKTQSEAALRAKLKEPWEDMQLPVYLLLAPEAADACYLAIGKDCAEKRADIDLEEWKEGAQSLLAEIFSSLHAGTALRAQGIEEVCAHCEMRGLCRKDYWS